MNEKAFGCVGTTIRLSSGVYLDLLDPQPSDIRIGDVACALSKICRFGGQIDNFYSVAEHSVAAAEVARLRGLDREVQFAALLHDAAEAFIGDIVKPLKVILDPIYGPIELRIEKAIEAAFNVDLLATSGFWKRIDRELLIAERRALFSPDKVSWAGEEQVVKLDYEPQCLSPNEAAKLFLSLFELLKGIT